MKNKIMNAALLLMLATPITAQENPDIMVVFDASGSMWGQIDGRTKIEIARDAFSDLSGEWSDLGSNVGLIAYGHRRKGDCGDIELISRPESGSTAQLGALVQSLTPRGKTPLSDAVIMAAQELRFTENAATVILLSDGRETCGRNTCEVGAELERLGVDFTAHVIGFDVNDAEARAQLQCLANNTGGQYFDAGNAGELSSALSQITQNDTPALAIEAATQTVDLSIDIIEAEGTYRPAQVSLRATNLESGAVVELATLTDAREVVQGWAGSLPAGHWKIEALSAEGHGEIEVRLSGAQAQVNIPFAAFSLDFILTDNGPYLLGAEQIMLLTPTTAIQQNAQLTVAMFPEGAREISQRMDYSYQFGAAKGQVLQHWFDSPPSAGNYDIMVMRGNDFDAVIFSQTIRYEAMVEPRWSGPRQGEAGARLPVQLSGMNNGYASLVLSKDGRQIWDSWYSKLITDEGIFLPLPSEEGDYDLSVKYKNAEGEWVETSLGVITAGSMLLQDDPDAVAPPEMAEAASMQLGYWVLIQRFTGEDITTIEVLDETLRADMPFENRASTLMGRGEALMLQSLALVDGGLAIGFQTEFGLAEGVLTPTEAGFEGTMASAKGEVFVPVRLAYLGDIGLSAGADGGEPEVVGDYPVAYLCDEAFCNQIAAEFALTWALPNGWGATAPYYYTTAGGAKAALPSMEFVALQGGEYPFEAALNPRQWMAANGPCFEVTRGELCRTSFQSKSDEPAFIALLSSLREVPLSSTPLSAADIERLFQNPEEGQ